MIMKQKSLLLLIFILQLQLLEEGPFILMSIHCMPRDLSLNCGK